MFVTLMLPSVIMNSPTPPDTVLLTLELVLPAVDLDVVNRISTPALHVTTSPVTRRLSPVQHQVLKILCVLAFHWSKDRLADINEEAITAICPAGRISDSSAA